MPVFGDFCIVAAALTTTISTLLYLFVWRGKHLYRQLARYFFTASMLSIAAALLTLLLLILRHDFTVAYVFSYSSTDLPWYYLVSSLWGGQEGTFLLWIFFVSIMAFVMMRSARSFEVGNMFFVNLFVLAILVILLKKSPFEYLPVFRSEGAGLNPLLQNFWMTIHPPIMFVGFAGTLFPFVYGLTGLIERRYDVWAEAARKWTLFAWTALGVSLVMGGYWAYKTLGWGGFWAWDPVENSSFIPWIFLTAQVHTLFIKRQRRGLMRFSLIIVCLTFWSVLYGTFLTRSGVLADFSVHSFVDLGINNFLIGGLLLFVGLGSYLLLLRWQDIKPGPSYSRVASRSYVVTLGIVVLFLGGILTLLGTSAPLLTRFAENPSNVGISYYFATMTPVAIVVLFLLALFPSLKWNHGMKRPALLFVGGVIGLITALLLFIVGVTSQVLYLLLFWAAVWAILSNGYIVYSSWRTKGMQAAYLAHIGIAVAIVGAAVSAGFEKKKTITLPQSQLVNESGYSMRFTELEETPKGFNCHVQVKRGGTEFVAILPHEFPKNQEGVMRKPYVEKFLGYDFYMSPLALEEPENNNTNQLILSKGETASFDKYTITFHDFELGSHGEEAMTEAKALLTVVYENTEEEVVPSIRLVGGTLETTPGKFDYGKASVVIAGVRPEDGSVVLEFRGDFLPQTELQTASLVIELSEKPLINLFWLGTILVFISGALSMQERRKRHSAIAVKQS